MEHGRNTDFGVLLHLDLLSNLCFIRVPSVAQDCFPAYIVRMLTSHEIEIRVRYQETDGQGRVHHANYLTWFELGRVELLRAMGHSYRELEAAGVMLVVAEMNVQYFLPAFFDDVLTLRTAAVKAKGARIEHEYKVHRGSDVLAQATSTIACIDRAGKVSRLPTWLAGKSKEKESSADS
jgi:acyl-CoA thioester hydrolase